MKPFYVYILASKRNGTLYTGSTDSINTRVWLHRTKAIKGFTAKYDVTMLVWFEQHDTRANAFRRDGRSRSGSAAGSWS